MIAQESGKVVGTNGSVTGTNGSVTGTNDIVTGTNDIVTETSDIVTETRKPVIKAVQYSLSETVDGRNVAVVDDDILSGIYTGKWDNATADKAKKAAKTALLKFKDGIAVKGITAKVNKISRDEYARSNYSEALRRHDGEAYADKMRAASVADDVVVAATNWNRDGGLTYPRKDDFVDFDRGQTLISSGNNKYSATVVLGITADGEYVFYDVEDIVPAQFDIKKDEAPPAVTPDKPFDAIQRDSNGDIITQPEGKVNPESQENVSKRKTDEKGENSRSEAINAEGKQTGAETVQDETAGASPRSTGEFGGQGEVIDGATSSSTVSDGPPKSDVFEENSQLGSPSVSSLEKADLERAKRDAERIIEWERKEAPTVDELNRVRGAVKNFDSLSGDRQRAIVRMVRSGKNIDESVIRGVSNIMAITNKKGAVLAPDVEIRFAEFGKDSTRRGIKTEVGGKTVILLNANAKSTDILRGTIAHEIVHYLENRKGYKALAEYAMKHAKADKVAKIRETYRKEYTNEERKANPNATEEEIAARVDEKMRDEAAVNSEIVGNVVAELLGSEKFLKRYAQMGEEQSSVVKRIARFVKGIANALKDKDGEASAVSRQMMDLVDRALGSEVEGEKRSNDYIQFSLMSNDTLEESVDKIISMSDEDAIANKEAGNFISIANKTPQVILDHVEGAENLEIVMRFDSFYLATRHEGALDGHYHNYGNIMKQLPNIIADPQAIIRMDNGRINIYSQIQTKKGNNSIVSIELNTVKDINSKYNKYNLIVSVVPAKDNYARNNLEKHGVKVEY